MTSPIETIADALIAFILSLLRDPEAAEEFASSPQPVLAQHGLNNVCMADVASVRPVIVDHPQVVPHNPAPPTPAPYTADPAQEIVRMVQQYTTVDARSTTTIDARSTTTIDARSTQMFESHSTTMIDARSTITDQSVNQNIWTEGGDVTQQFDQEAVISSGDQSVAAGGDAAVVDSDVDVTVGDVAIGNEEYTGSFNTTGAAAPDGGAPVAPVVASALAAPRDLPEPADLLEGDMTSSGSDAYEADASTAVDDQPIDAPLDDD